MPEFFGGMVQRKWQNETSDPGALTPVDIVCISASFSVLATVVDWNVVPSSQPAMHQSVLGDWSMYVIVPDMPPVGISFSTGQTTERLLAVAAL